MNIIYFDWLLVLLWSHIDSSTIKNFFVFFVHCFLLDIFFRQISSLSQKARICTNTNFSAIHPNTKFASPMAIMRNAKGVLMYVSSRIDDMNDGGTRIMIVVNKPATITVTIKGTKMSFAIELWYHFVTLVCGREGRR
jgi:hypothetical protein